MSEDVAPPWLAQISTWVFDLDDTIFPEREFVMGGFRAVAQRVLAERQVDVLDTLIKNFERGVRRDAFRVALLELGVPIEESYAVQLVETYRLHCPVLEPFEDAPPLLRELSARDQGRIGIVTDGFADVQRRKVSALPVCRLARSIVFTDELGGRDAWKPNPIGLLRCLDELGCNDPGSAVYIADNPAKDFLAARRAGVHGIRIARLGTEHGAAAVDDESKAPDITLPSLAALWAQLQL